MLITARNRLTIKGVLYINKDSSSPLPTRGPNIFNRYRFAYTFLLRLLILTF